MTYRRQAAVQVGRSRIQAGPNQHRAAIASLAKMMTAYLVLRDHPLRRGRRESIVSVAAGERLTERHALRALLLPSANNIAAVLARWDAAAGLGTAAAMVDRITGRRTVPNV